MLPHLAIYFQHHIAHKSLLTKQETKWDTGETESHRCSDRKGRSDRKEDSVNKSCTKKILNGCGTEFLLSVMLLRGMNKTSQILSFCDHLCCITKWDHGFFQDIVAFFFFFNNILPKRKKIVIYAYFLGPLH